MALCVFLYGMIICNTYYSYRFLLSFNIRRVVTLDRRDINLLCSRTEIGIVRISCPIPDLYILSNHFSLMLDVRIYLLVSLTT